MTALFFRTIWEVYSHQQKLIGAVMALQFKKRKAEAIAFGDIVEVPKLDIEKRLRIQHLSLKNATDVKEAIQVMSECFESDGVAEFMKNEMTVIDLARLQAYLIGGEEMVDKIDGAMKDGE